MANTFGTIAPGMPTEEDELEDQTLREQAEPGGSMNLAPPVHLYQVNPDPLGGGPMPSEPNVAPAEAALPSPTLPSKATGEPSPVDDLTVNDILHPDTPAVKARSRKVKDIAADLMARGQDALKNLGVESGVVSHDNPNPDHDEMISQAIASEVQAAQNRGGNTATDWYTKGVEEAMQHAQDIWPELKDDPHQQMGLKAALAITSQGEKVASNVRLATQAYEHFRQTGQFPTDIDAKAGDAMNGNFDKMNKLMEKLGPEGTRNFLNQDFTVKELKDLGYDVGGENMNTTVKGSAILGPKIGQGFYQNLNGNYDPVTMDLWFMRAMGRLTGTLVGRPTEKPQARFENAMRAANMQVPNDPDNLEGIATDIMAKHEKDFAKNRADYDSGAKTKSELTLSADRYLHNLSGINEQPLSGAHRDWLRGRVNRAREILGEQGNNMTNADLQATWWYPEKELYSKLGGRPSEEINTDYATAFRNLKAARSAAEPGPE